MTPYVSPITMQPAIKTPMPMLATAYFRSSFIMAATSAPVHAPVPGSGIATNKIRPAIS